MSLLALVSLFALPTAAPAQGGTEVLLDGGFEGGPGGGAWTEASTNFGTPICSLMACGGLGPRTGTYWAWFGGTGEDEVASLAQTRTIPVGTASLSFWLAMPSCDPFGLDSFVVKVDSSTLFTRLSSDPACNMPGYVQHVLDVSAFADGGQHTVSFVGTVVGPPSGTVTNIYVDDVSLTVLVPSTTKVKAKVKKRIKVTGSVSPPRPGSAIKVTLFKKKKGGFKRVKQVTVPLSSTSRFKASFKVPVARKCRVVASWPGDADTLGSTAQQTFRC